MFDSAKASENIKNEFIDYITTAHTFANQDLQAQLKSELKDTIAKGPFIEINEIFKTGKSIKELVSDGILSELFLELEASKPNTIKYKPVLPLDRPLYLHQEKAIKTIVSGDNAVVSTGTGSGKTNCFLIAVINELLKEKENGTLNDGVRALFIYPMNALSNDQMKNIRELLMMYPDITFGSYNGGTEHNEEDAISVYEAMFANESIEELRHRLPNEILSRDELKKTPPNILFTNYAMLEHMLFRPNDDVLFSNADFKFVVLDEAHVYNGATGIETSLLLRRLRARISSSRDTQFILTSATLGSDSKADDDIVQFAKNLCGVNFNKENIVRAIREEYAVQQNMKRYDYNMFIELSDTENIVSEILDKYNIEYNKGADEKELLYDLLIKSELYQNMRLSKLNCCSLADFSKTLNINIQVAMAFIAICTRAQKNRKALIDARYHFFVRSLEGCYISLNSSPKVFLNRQKHYYEAQQEYVVFEVAICDDCGEIALVGDITDNRLSQVSKLGQEVEYYYIVNNLELDYDDEVNDGTEIEKYKLCIKCGAIAREDEAHNLMCKCNTPSYITVAKARQLKAGARCGNCYGGKYRRMYLGNDAATSVLASALYEELPEITHEEEPTITVKSTNIFAKAIAKNKKKKRITGRQFLAFSDSRQEAAKFACYLGKSYNEFLRRRGIWHLIEQKRTEIIEEEYSISEFVKLLTNYFNSNKSFAKSNNDDGNLTITSRQNAWVALINELTRFKSTTSLTSLGMLQFEYKGNNTDITSEIVSAYGVPEKDVKALLDLLIFEIVKTGAIITDTQSDIDDNDREYIFYTASQRYITFFETSGKKKATISNWAPKNRKDKVDEYYISNKLYLVCRVLNIDQAGGYDFLKQYFDFLTDPENNAYCLEDINKNGTFVLPAKHFVVKVAGSKDAYWYKCKKCGRISQFAIDGKCATINCEGELVKQDPNELKKYNHYAKLYSGDRMSPLFIKEHTAQLSKKEAADYQQQFIKKEINALSCSTTFEMGVDVGDLETVFLRNVPPLPSNYAQRAGRAGRSVNAAAYVLTFAKLSSHDFAFFNNPKLMINGVILPPIFKVDNEKIVKRHIYAIALGMFFALNKEYYNHNDARKFINEKGYMIFKEWLNTHPAELELLIKKSIPDISDLYKRVGIDEFRWLNDFIGEDGVLARLICEYESNLENFDKQIRLLKKVNDLQGAASCEIKKRIYSSNKLIEFLARGNVLPKYGFPVDTVELYQNSMDNSLSKLRLNRDLQIAIAEYAPSSEVIANGRMYTSRYIKKAALGNNRDWHTAYIGRCDNPECKATNYSITPIGASGVECSSCGKTIPALNFIESIEPRSGFVAEKRDKDVPLTKQEKNYKSEDYYIGDKNAKETGKYEFLFNGNKITLESTTNDSMLVKSSTIFYVCPTCGYAIAEDENFGDKKAEKEMRKGRSLKIITGEKHDSLFGNYPCKSQELKRTCLHHVFKTDVAKITFDCDTSNYDTMVSVIYAVLNSISIILNIEARDIKACLTRYVSNNGRIGHSIIIYDGVPGGAGHSRRLVEKEGKLLYQIFMNAMQSMLNCDCDPSCYKCLRSYSNQKIHDKLNRISAYNFFKKFKGEITKVEIESSN